MLKILLWEDISGLCLTETNFKIYLSENSVFDYILMQTLILGNVTRHLR